MVFFFDKGRLTTFNCQLYPSGFFNHQVEFTKLKKHNMTIRNILLAAALMAEASSILAKDVKQYEMVGWPYGNNVYNLLNRWFIF